jgi:pentatricopeptide repeat protein
MKNFIKANYFIKMKNMNKITQMNYSINQVLDLRNEIKKKLNNHNENEAIKLIEEFKYEKEYEQYIVDMYQTIIRQLISKNNISEVDRILKDLETKNIKVNKYTIHTLITYYLQNNRIKEAALLYNDPNFEKDAAIYTTVIKFYLDNKQYKKAMILHKEVSDKGIELQITAHNDLLFYYTTNNFHEKVADYFNNMKEKNSTTYSIIIRYKIAQDKGKEAMEIYETIKSNPKNLNPSIYTSLIIYNLKINEVEKAMEYFNEMHDNGIEANIKWYNSILNHLVMTDNIKESKKVS